MADNLTGKQLIAYEKIIAGEDVCIFGKGGSGKSYLIELTMNTKTLLLAPTGMAALNLGNTARTIHSTLMIGEKSLNAWNWEKVKSFIESKESILKNFFDKYDRIVFDEGSMIISGLFNTFVQLFHTIYKTDSRSIFNGLQIIMLFDPLQLPPVKNSMEPYLDLNNKGKSPQLSRSDYIVNNPDFKALFNARLDNIIHLDVNMRNRDPEWNEVLDACRTGFKLCSQEDKIRLLTLLNERVFTRNHTCIDGAPLKELYDNNTITSLKRSFIEEVNKKRLNKLMEINNETFTIDRIVKVTKETFILQNIDRCDNPCKLYDLSKNYMDDLGGYYSSKIKNSKWEIITEFIITVNQRVMLRNNQLHPKLKNGSLGNIVDIECNENHEVICIKVKFDTLDDEYIDVKRVDFKHPDISEMCITAFPIIPSSAITLHKLQGQTWESPLFIHYCDIPYFEKQEHLLYTGISRNKHKNDIYIISDIELNETYFPVNKVMFDWYTDHV